jgi:hypothetical protein
MACGCKSSVRIVLSASASNGPSPASGPSAFWPSALKGVLMPPAKVPRERFPPDVTIHVARLNCDAQICGVVASRRGLPRTGAPTHRRGDCGG